MIKKHSSIVRKHIDSFIVLFLFFTLILSMLLFNLYKIDEDIKNYNTYSKKIDDMIALEYKMENLFLKAFRYLDYDEATYILKSFDADISYLLASDISKEFGEHIHEDMQNIKDIYNEKLNLLEYFKTSNARVTNSIYYLYDLRKTIDKKYLKNRQVQELLNKFFFIVGQSLMDLPYDDRKLLLTVERINSYSTDDILFNYFYLHGKQFIFDMESIKKYLKDKDEIKLYSSIVNFQKDLNNFYIKNRSQYEKITLAFFILAFLLLLILIFTYYRVRKTTRELLAFRYAIENSDNTIVITDVDRNIEYVNELFEIKTGYTKEEVYGKNPHIIKSDLVPDSIYKDLNETLDSGKKWQGELVNRAKDGSLIYEKTSIVPIFMDDELVKYLAIKLDITEYIKQQKILQQSAVVYDMIGDGIVITDKNKKVLSVNPAFIEMFGYSEEEILGVGPSVVSTLDDESVFYQKLWSQLMEHDRWSGKLNNRTKSGTIIPTWLTVSIVRDKNREIQNFIAIYTNLTEIINMEEKAEHLAYHDSLTGLPNRAQFERQITDVLDLAKIKETQVAVLFIDLDRFKVINDTLGHHIGDKMLIELSIRIKNILVKDNMLARIGGDEFVIIVNDVPDRAYISKLADEILLLTREPIKVDDYNLYITVSIGIAFYPDDGEEKSEIIKHADSAMYHAKDSGKDNYQFYTRQLSLDVEARLNMEQELLLALERKELTVYYQPQYYIKSGKISGAEALLRWKNKNIGWISPDEFISVAEETGIIVNIGYFVFEEACKEYMRWQNMGLDIDSISINISSTQFREEDMLYQLKKIIAQTGISPSCIEIEITERFIMEYSTTNLTILEDLRSIGCRISIDDFGTGYSSLSYMKSLSLDTIKIDKSFISDLPSSSHDAEVSKAIIALSKSLGYQVIAEGIETKEQEMFLKNYHCDVGQGYYFAKPMEADKFISFVKEKSKKI